jgi:hypothetical protein
MVNSLDDPLRRAISSISELHCIYYNTYFLIHVIVIFLEPVSKVDVDSLDIRVPIFIGYSLFITSVYDVLMKRILSILSSKPGLLVPSEWHVRRNKASRVHEN